MPVRLEATVRSGGGRAAPDAAGWLGLAAAPTFAAMALATALADDGGMRILCADAAGGSPLTGMATMYLLMSAFHLPPWLKRLGRRGDFGR